MAELRGRLHGSDYEVEAFIDNRDAGAELLYEVVTYHDEEGREEAEVLASIPVARSGFYQLSFNAAAYEEVHVRVVARDVRGEARIRLGPLNWWQTVMVPGGEVLATVCNGKDAYRFGFNTQEKLNEIAGPGNHTTALFWEYDSRLGRRWNIDPVDQVSISNYAVLENNPVFKADHLGDVILPWWISGGSYRIPGYQGGIPSNYKSFRDKENLQEFNRIALDLYKSNDVFKQVVEQLKSSKTVYQVQQFYETSFTDAANYLPATKTIKILYDGIDKSALFEETFHAGQDDYYTPRGITRDLLTTEVEAKAAQILYKYRDASVKNEYNAIRAYFKTGEKGKGFDKEVNTLIQDVYDTYSRSKGESWKAKNDPKGVDKKTLFKYLESLTVKKDKADEK